MQRQARVWPVWVLSTLLAACPSPQECECPQPTQADPPAAPPVGLPTAHSTSYGVTHVPDIETRVDVSAIRVNVRVVGGDSHVTLRMTYPTHYQTSRVYEGTVARDCQDHDDQVDAMLKTGPVYRNLADGNLRVGSGCGDAATLIPASVTLRTVTYAHHHDDDEEADAEHGAALVTPVCRAPEATPKTPGETETKRLEFWQAKVAATYTLVYKGVDLTGRTFKLRHAGFVPNVWPHVFTQRKDSQGRWQKVAGTSKPNGGRYDKRDAPEFTACALSTPFGPEGSLDASVGGLVDGPMPAGCQQALDRCAELSDPEARLRCITEALFVGCGYQGYTHIPDIEISGGLQGAVQLKLESTNEGTTTLELIIEAPAEYKTVRVYDTAGNMPHNSQFDLPANVERVARGELSRWIEQGGLSLSSAANCSAGGTKLMPTTVTYRTIECKTAGGGYGACPGSQHIAHTFRLAATTTGQPSQPPTGAQATRVEFWQPPIRLTYQLTAPASALSGMRGVTYEHANYGTDYPRHYTVKRSTRGGTVYWDRDPTNSTGSANNGRLANDVYRSTPCSAIQ